MKRIVDSRLEDLHLMYTRWPKRHIDRWSMRAPISLFWYQENLERERLVSNPCTLSVNTLETTKFLLQYFTAMGQREKNRSGSKSKDSDNIETRVLESTPVLEAFGNAKTL